MFHHKPTSFGLLPCIYGLGCIQHRIFNISHAESMHHHVRNSHYLTIDDHAFRTFGVLVVFTANSVIARGWLVSLTSLPPLLTSHAS